MHKTSTKRHPFALHKNSSFGGTRSISAVWTSDGDELEDREEHVDADDSSRSESEIWKLPLRVLSGLMSLHGLQQEPWQAYEEACSPYRDQMPQHVLNTFC